MIGISILLENTAASEAFKPRHGLSIAVETGDSRVVIDDFSHEGIVVVDDGELVVFSSCSHNGIYNIVASVKAAFVGKRVRSYVGGLHYFDPITRRREGERELDRAVRFFKDEGIRLYSGHCTGERCLDYLGKKMGNDFARISTGNELLV